MISGFVILTFAVLARTPRASVRIPKVLAFAIDFSFLIPLTLLLVLPVLAGITTYDRGVFFVVISFVILLSWGLGYAEKQHAISVRVAVREVVDAGKFQDWKAQRIFPEDYFDPPES